MAKSINLSVEADKHNRLYADVPEEIYSKSDGGRGVVEYVLGQRWEGEEKRIAEHIRKQLRASNGSSVSLAQRDGSNGVKYQPIKLGETITRYIDTSTTQLEKPRVIVTPDHVVG